MRFCIKMRLATVGRRLRSVFFWVLAAIGSRNRNGKQRRQLPSRRSVGMKCPAPFSSPRGKRNGKEMGVSRSAFAFVLWSMIEEPRRGRRLRPTGVPKLLGGAATPRQERNKISFLLRFVCERNKNHILLRRSIWAAVFRRRPNQADSCRRYRVARWRSCTA